MSHGLSAIAELLVSDCLQLHTLTHSIKIDFLVEELDRIIGKLTKFRDNLKTVSISDE